MDEYLFRLVAKPCSFVIALTSKAEKASSEVTKLQSALADDNAGQAATDSLLEEIAKLKAGVAAERVRFTHITEALEATKGSAEEVSVTSCRDDAVTM